MEIDVSKENICVNKLVSEKRELIFVEEDMIVPDSKPDILNTINLNGNVCVYKKEVLDDKVKLDGCVNTYVMYLPDSQEDNLRGLNANIDFSKSIQMPDARDGMNAVVSVSIKDLECKVLNGRKINLRAGLEVCIKLYSNEDIEFINSVNNIECMQMLQENFELNSLIGSGSTRVYVKDTLSIDAQDEMAEILKCDVSLVDSDIKISYNKILSKCEAEVKIMYLTEDNRINTVEGRIPAVGFIDMQNVSEENICDVNNEIKNILIRPNPSEEHSIYIEIELETTCISYEKKTVSLIQDLYSPTTDLNFTQKKVTINSNKITKNKTFTVTSKTNITNLTEENLLDVEITSALNKQQITSSKVMYEGEIALNFIFTKEGNSVNSKVSKVPFDFSMDNPTENDNIDIETKILINNRKFDVRSNGDIDCNVEMEFITEFSQNININIIDNIEVNEEREATDDYQSLIMYIVQPGDSLWKIAKKFRSTVDEIAVVNGIENRDKILVGQKIYIPKFTYVEREYATKQ